MVAVDYEWHGKLPDLKEISLSCNAVYIRNMCSRIIPSCKVETFLNFEIKPFIQQTFSEVCRKTYQEN